MAMRNISARARPNDRFKDGNKERYPEQCDSTTGLNAIASLAGPYLRVRLRPCHSPMVACDCNLFSNVDMQLTLKSISHRSADE